MVAQLVGLITCGTCLCAVSASLQVFTSDGATCRPRELGDVRDCTECSRCVEGKVSEEEEVIMEDGA